MGDIRYAQTQTFREAWICMTHQAKLRNATKYFQQDPMQYVSSNHHVTHCLFANKVQDALKLLFPGFNAAARTRLLCALECVVQSTSDTTCTACNGQHSPRACTVGYISHLTGQETKPSESQGEPGRTFEKPQQRQTEREENNEHETPSFLQARKEASAASEDLTISCSTGHQSACQCAERNVTQPVCLQLKGRPTFQCLQSCV